MKFLLAVLAIHLVGELISNKRKNRKRSKAGEINEIIRHPAEHELR